MVIYLYFVSCFVVIESLVYAMYICRFFVDSFGGCCSVYCYITRVVLCKEQLLRSVLAVLKFFFS